MTTTPERVLIEERANPLIPGKRVLTTRFGDINHSKPATAGEYPTPAPAVIMFPTMFYEAAALAHRTDRVAWYEGTQSELNDESNVLTITANNGTWAYDVHPAYWPLGPGDMSWYVGVLR
jgi:hypothetical protein